MKNPPTNPEAPLLNGSDAEIYPVSYLDVVPSGGWTYEYKTTKLVMRRIPSGIFIMGSPEDELGRLPWIDETQHEVTLTQDFYIGVFPVTERQWQQVMGGLASYLRDSHPKVQVSYNDIRGSSAGAAWPTNGNVDATAFMGRLRARTGLMNLDLPTEGQWEYACRAGTPTALNSGKNLTDAYTCPNVSEVGRYLNNDPGGTNGGTAEVGSYLPNAWGLYDMHGNVWEWCLDRFGPYPGTVTDPRGPSEGWSRVRRGGSWDDVFGASSCRSASRNEMGPSYRYGYLGFRLSRTMP